MSVQSPRVTVLLPVFNGAPFLASAIESVLAQSFTNYELLILNDGSSDNSAVIAQGYQDSRIRYFEHSNMGLPATLNAGSRFARGEFIFRQDQDDLSYPERFSRQVAYLDAHPEVAVLGTWARIFIDGDPEVAYRFHRHPTSHAAVALSTVFDSSFVHSSVAMRRSAFEALGGYSCDPMRQPPEDFELWSRMCQHYKVANLPEVLVDYREVASSMSRVLSQDFTERMIRISAENLRYWLKGTSYVTFSDRLSRIYHLDGRLPTESADGPMIDRALDRIGLALSQRGETHSCEYKDQLRRLSHQLKRNYWLGRSSGKAVRQTVKAIFRAYKILNG